MPINDTYLKSAPDVLANASFFDPYVRREVPGFEDITTDIRRGAGYWYDKNNIGKTRFFTGQGDSVYAMNEWASEPDLTDLKEIPYSQVRSMLPKRDYIGGKPLEARITAIKRVPGLTDRIYERARAYGVDPDLMIHRFIREGYVDNIIKAYNGDKTGDFTPIYADEQKDYFNTLWNDNDISGYHNFGLDYAGDELMDDKYSLLDPKATWESMSWADDEGEGNRYGNTVVGDLRSMIEIMAAAMKWRHGLATGKYGEGDDEWRYTNAMWNMGQNNDKLDNIDYVRENYSYPEYYSKYGLHYDDGGTLKRILSVYGNDVDSVRAAIKGLKANQFKKGGKEETYEGGMLPEAEIIGNSVTTKKLYKLSKSEYKRAKKEASNIKKSIKKYIKDNGYFKDDDSVSPFVKAIEEAPSVRDAREKYKYARDNYYSMPNEPNNILGQIYRYYSRHYGYKSNQKDRVNSGVGGADVIDLSKNVIRLTPDSKQSTALFNEFVESKYPSVLPASEYVSNPNRIIGDMAKFPASNVSIYAGIEDGKFKLDSLSNFNDNTVIFPARNIKSGTPLISKININDDGDSYRGYDWDKINAIMNITDNSLRNPYYILDDNIGNASLNNSFKTEIDRLNNWKNYLIDDLNSDNPQYRKHVNREMIRHNNKLIKALQKAIDGKDLSKAEHNLILGDSKAYVTLLSMSPMSAISNSQYIGRNEGNKYTYTDPNGNEHLISDFNAGILDGKTVLGNQNGGVFVGRIQDINEEQLDSLNNYLEKNPSWLLRPDLGSFDQYRLDNPSLEEYLKQYFEHPKADDPNVFTIGTLEPNKLWPYGRGGTLLLDYSKDGKIYKNDGPTLQEANEFVGLGVGLGLTQDRKGLGGTLLHDYKKGGIYIKPSHRGRFTELKERTGHSATWFKAHGTPAQRKMATFALNARKWKHALGGPIQRAMESDPQALLDAVRKLRSRA